MRAIIVGCGRVGAGLADGLARAGDQVTIIDMSSDAFRRLDPAFSGSAVRGDGTDEDVLRRAGAQGADVFFALTEGDNRNILAAQLASETLGIRQVVAKINDPVRADAYTSLGIATICRTTMLIGALARFVDRREGLPLSGEGVLPVTGHHPGVDHDQAREAEATGARGMPAGPAPAAGEVGTAGEARGVAEVGVGSGNAPRERSAFAAPRGK